MITKLVASGGRTRTTPVLAALAVVALAAAVPASAGAATRHATPALAQGAGMGAKPSAAVRHLQRQLQHQGYHLGRPGADGRFGPLTAAAVRRLQAAYGLSVDGIVGPKTRKLLRLAQRRARPPAASTSRPGSTKPSTSAKPSTRRTTPQPVATRTIVQKQSPDVGWLVVIAAAAALGVLFGAFGARGLRSRAPAPAGPAVAPIDTELYLEGESVLAGVGAFRGRALAATVTAPPGDQATEDDTLYLVHDASKPAPVWVHSAEIRGSQARLLAGEPVIGYVTTPPEASPRAADEPARAIEEACDDAGWRLLEVVSDKELGRPLERPGLKYALEQIAEGNARGLVIADLRRVSDSVVDLGALMSWFRDAHATLVALDLELDTSTATGQQFAASTITLAGWERERSSRRARSGLTQVSPRPFRERAEPSDLDPREQLPSLEGRSTS